MRLLTIVLIAVWSFVLPGRSVAQAVPPIQAEYSVRWAGIEVGRFHTELRIDGDRYHLAYQAMTAGPLRWVSNFHSSGWSLGRMSRSAVEPEHFRGESDWGEGLRFWQLSFDAAGEVSELVLDAKTRADREPVPAALRRGPDPLSVLLQAMQQVSAERPFEATVFDGRRVVELTLRCSHGQSPVELAALGPPTRSALRCLVDGERIAGQSKRWSESAEGHRQERRPVTTWLVPGIGGLPHWPVRIEAESRFGLVSVELDRFVGPGA
jgi:hypothetical protein